MQLLVVRLVVVTVPLPDLGLLADLLILDLPLHLVAVHLLQQILLNEPLLLLFPK